MSRNPVRRFLDTAVIAAVLSLAHAPGARAECFGPLCHAMHDMSGALQCILGKYPAMLCRGDMIAQLSSGAQTSRRFLLENMDKTPAEKTQINALFDRIYAAANHLADALKKKDDKAKADAIAELHAAMDEGHKAFKPPGPGSVH